MAEKIMIVDDELDIINLLRDFFLINDYEVITASSIDEAIEELKKEPDLILLDINMPGKNGLDFCKYARRNLSCPIIFLTAKAEAEDILLGFDVGGDDYITKPFDIRELLRRVQAQLRREKRAMRAIEAKKTGLVIDYAGMNVSFNGKPIVLTKAEFRIIEFLSTNPGIVFDKEKIFENVFGYDSSSDNAVIREHIRRIRKKFSDVNCESYIETFWGMGYKWKK